MAELSVITLSPSSKYGKLGKFDFKLGLSNSNQTYFSALVYNLSSYPKPKNSIKYLKY